MGPALPHPSTLPVQPPPARPGASRAAGLALIHKSKGVPRSLGRMSCTPPSPPAWGPPPARPVTFPAPFRAPGSRAQGRPEAWTHPAAPKGEATPCEDTAPGASQGLAVSGPQRTPEHHMCLHRTLVLVTATGSVGSCLDLGPAVSSPILILPSPPHLILSHLLLFAPLSAADPQK